MPKIIEDLENRILCAARQRLLGGDLSSFSARGIAEDCGIAVGTIYNYYRDKESLMGAVMAQDWQAELMKAGEQIAAAPSVEVGVLCLYEAIRAFSQAYENVWTSVPTGEGFGAMYRTRHKLLLSQIEGQLSALYARFGPTPEPGRLILLAELIIAASQHQEVGAADLLSFIRGGMGPCTPYRENKEDH
ncbi:MAG: TetR/AcrR family transcriptional regulator [Clostridia bacterium]|nr:TetR/AcrR family transcriptional regulator [Clostridia bacterium]